MASEGFTFEMSGSGRQRTGQIDMTLALPKLGLLQEDVGGAASAKGKVLLTPTGGDLQFSVDLTVDSMVHKLVSRYRQVWTPARRARVVDVSRTARPSSVIWPRSAFSRPNNVRASSSCPEPRKP